jgi:hypothetical protein
MREEVPMEEKKKENIIISLTSRTHLYWGYSSAKASSLKIQKVILGHPNHHLIGGYIGELLKMLLAPKS